MIAKIDLQLFANISNSTNNSLVSGTSGADYITNTGSYSTMNGGAGNDTISGGGLRARFNGDAGDDYIISRSNYVTINGGTGADRISLTSGAYGNVIEYAAGDGNDTIFGFDYYDTLKITSGTYYTITSGDDVLVYVGSGLIRLKDATGTYSGHIVGTYSSSYNYYDDDDEDEWGDADADADADDDVDADADDDYDYSNYSSYGVISASSYSDWIYNSGKYSTIYAGSGNDYIYNYDGDYASINAGSGNDSIRNYYSGSSTLNAEDGNDIILNYSDNVYIDAGAGDDSVNSNIDGGYYGWYATIHGGTGNDTITGSTHADVFLYANGDGNDVIYGFDSSDTLKITSGTYSTTKSGSDVIVSVGSGSIRLKDASGTTLHIAGTYSPAGVTLSNYTSNSLVSGTSYADSIYNGGSYSTINGGDGNDTIDNRGDRVSISGGAGNDSIVSNKSSGWGWYVTVRGGAGNDTITGSSYADVFQYASGDGNDIITNFGSNDTLRITDGSSYRTLMSGSDLVVSVGSGSITLKNVSSANIAGGSLVSGSFITNSTSNRKITGTDDKDTISNSATYVTINAGSGNDTVYNSAYYVTVNAGAGKDTVRTSGDYVSVDGGKGNDRISNSGSGNYYNTMRGGAGNDSIYNYGWRSYVDGGADNDYIYNNYYYATLDGGSGNDTIYSYYSGSSYGNSIYGGAGDDSIYNYGYYNTIRGGVGNDTVTGTGYYRIYQYASGDGYDVITNFGSSDTIKITDSSSYRTLMSGSDLVVSVGSGSITLKNVSSANIAGGNFVPAINYTTNSTGSKKINGSDGIDYIKNTGKKSTVNAGNGNDSINNTAASAKLLGGKGNDTIRNSGASVSIDGGKGNDRIINTGSKVTITAGAGTDTITGSDSYGDFFRFGSGDGKNIITNFGDNDTIQITDGSFKSIAKSGDNAIVSLKSSSNSATITLKGAGNLNLANSNGFITARDEITTLLNREANVDVDGTSGDDLIVNYKAGVTIEGGLGNDTIRSSNNGEMILFGATDGHDVIVNFDENDTIKITGGSISGNTIIGDDYVVSVRSSTAIGTITFQDCGDDASKFKQSGNYLKFDPINYIENRDKKKKVKGSTGKDYITNYAKNVTIAAGGGDDTIVGSSYGEMFLFGAADEHDYITNFGQNDTVSITSGSIQSTVVSGNNVIINVSGGATSVLTLGGAGNYNFIQNGNVLTVDKINVINNRDRDNVTVSGTADRDLITNYSSGVTIKSGAGNDTITGSNSGEVFLFGATDDQNIITNFGRNDTLRCSSGSISGADYVDDDYVVTIKSDKSTATVTLKNTANYKWNRKSKTLAAEPYIYIKNTENNQSITGSGNAEYIENSGENVTIQANGGNDTIEGSNFGDLFLFAYNHGDNLITNFDKNDTLKCINGYIFDAHKSKGNVVVTMFNQLGTRWSKVTLAGAGDLNVVQSGNTIYVDAVNEVDNDYPNTLVAGSPGRDFITNSGAGVTIQPGGGNDTIEGCSHGEVYAFGYTDGNNLITDFGENDTLYCSAGTIKKTLVSGDDLLVTLKNGTDAICRVTLGGAGDYNWQKKDNIYLYAENCPTLKPQHNGELLLGTNGDDYMVNTGYINVTLQPNGGNDTLVGSNVAEVFAFDPIDEKNVVVDFGVGDSIKALNGTLSTMKSGRDYIVTISDDFDSCSVTLQGVGNCKFKKNETTLWMKSASSAQMPSEDYWFDQDASEDELGDLLPTSAIDNAIGMLDPSSEISIGSARKDDFIPTISRHREKH